MWTISRRLRRKIRWVSRPAVAVEEKLHQLFYQGTFCIQAVEGASFALRQVSTRQYWAGHCLVRSTGNVGSTTTPRPEGEVLLLSCVEKYHVLGGFVEDEQSGDADPRRAHKTNERQHGC